MTRLSSLAPGYRALVFGASGGIGAAITAALADDPDCGALFAASRRSGASPSKALALSFDLANEASIEVAIGAASADGPLDFIFVATGMLHNESIRPEKSLKAMSISALEEAFRVNTIGPAMIAKHALPRLRKDAKAIFAVLSARVGSISDNRLGGWHSYRASKAALNMLVKTCSIEMARTHRQSLCVALHPGTVDTPLSAPFQGNVAEGRLFTPAHSAAALLSVLDTLDASQTGGLFAWNGEAIAF